MCPTPLGRVHTRVASLIPGALLGVILSLISGRPDWIVLIGVFLLLGVALDAGVYSWLLKYQPPWMTGVLALAEFGLLLVLANILQLDLSLLEATAFYWVVWALASAMRIAVLPIASLTYLESSGEFRRVEWSVPAPQASIPIIAAPEPVGSGSGLFAAATSGGAIPERQPSPSGVQARPAGALPGSVLRLVEIQPEAGRELLVDGSLSIGREACDVNLPNPEVSRRHALIRTAPEGLVLEDLRSSNGTFVNGRMLSGSRTLAAGDELRIADTVWKVDLPSDDDHQPPPVQGGQLTVIRGDVPPPELEPSAVRRIRALPPSAATPEPRFSRSAASSLRSSAARRIEATAASAAAVAGTAIAVIAYLAARG